MTESLKFCHILTPCQRVPPSLGKSDHFVSAKRQLLGVLTPPGLEPATYNFSGPAGTRSGDFRVRTGNVTVNESSKQ